MTMTGLPIVADDFLLKGRVVDEENNALEFATVSCLEQAKFTITNLKGEFNIKLHSADSVTVKFSMVGYGTRSRTLRRPRGTQTLQIVLHPSQSLGEVVVTERRRQTTPTEQLNLKDIQGAPSVSGNVVEELIQQQAGVSTHNELSSQYNVRGGSYDENSVYIMLNFSG